MRISNVYQDLEARFHEPLWDEMAPDMEAELILKYLEKTSEPWLEIGSGNGRILKPIVRAGQVVEALEPSESMLQASQEALPECKHHLRTLEDFEWQPKAYGAILFTAFVGSLLEDLDASLAKAKHLLKSGGGLVMTQFVPWAELSGEAPAGKWYTDQRIPANEQLTETLELRTKHQIFRHSQRLIREHKYVLTDSKGKKIDSDHCQQNLRWYYYKELCEKLEKHGFKIERTVWDLSQEKIDEDAPVFTIFASS